MFALSLVPIASLNFYGAGAVGSEKPVFCALEKPGSPPPPGRHLTLFGLFVFLKIYFADLSFLLVPLQNC